jgi:hypothetical protein
MGEYFLSTSSYASPVYLVGPDGQLVNLAALLTSRPGGGSSADGLDTDGNPVPVYKAHTFTYDTSGNLLTDTVSDGTGTWVRTFTYVQGAQTADSGWVKQ